MKTNTNKKTFNPEEWDKKPEPAKPTGSAGLQTRGNKPRDNKPRDIEDKDRQKIEAVTARIEAQGLDLTTDYDRWLHIGFALADALGEEGRAYYHRLSRFYPGYTEKETDKKFTSCLNSQKGGVTIATFYQYAKEAGIDIGSAGLQTRDNQARDNKSRDKQNPQAVPIEEDEETLPTFPESIKEKLPEILKRILAVANSPQDADLLLLGALTCFSACLPHICGLYDGRTVYTTLMLFVSARASAGKGRLTLCKKLVEPIHQHLRDIYREQMRQYKSDLKAYRAATDQDNIEEPVEPNQLMLFIPANSSSTRFAQLLYENNGCGLMFETEGDTLSIALDSDHGDFSPSLRKGFHHETISYTRRANREHVEIPSPRFSVLLSGTPHQVVKLIRNVENGLFSRFIFYSVNSRSEWRNVFSVTHPLDDYFAAIGADFFDLYKTLVDLPSDHDIPFSFTKEQEKKFNRFFDRYHKTFETLCGDEFVASVRRLGLITFRIAMVLSTLRIMEHGELPTEIICEDADFETALSMTEVLLQHTVYVFQTFPEEDPVKKHPRMQQWENFYNNLPAQFTRQDYVALAKEMNLTEKSADRHITAYCNLGQLTRPEHGKYRKPTA